MKIGILSMQRICNYGSFMQSYALKKIIESLGHEVQFVDYKIEKPILKSKTDNIKYIKEKFRNLIINLIMSSDFLMRLLPKNKKSVFNHIKRYNDEFLPLLGVAKKRNYKPFVDILVIGSDEVFNCLQSNIKVGYSKELFGYNNNAKKLISYAACFGNTTFERLKFNNIVDDISKMFSKFNCISVRDSNSGMIIKRLTNKEPVYNLDPVLIYDYSKDMPKVDIKSGYIVVYAYRSRLHNDEIEAIKDFASKKGKRLVCIGGYQQFCDEYIDASPFELLSYVNNADYVITDTFHGSIFSIINHKQFASFIRTSGNSSYGNQEKLMDLLKRLGLSQRGVFDASLLKEVIEKPIDYDEVERIRVHEIEKTKAYFKSNLQL